MNIQLESFAVNLDDQLEAAFVKWYHDNKHLTKTVVLQGFSCVHLGLSKFFENGSNIWKQRFEQLQNKLDVSIHDALATSTASLQAQLANKNDELLSVRASCEAQLASLQQTVAALKAQQSEQADAVKGSYEAMVASLKDQLECAKSQLSQQVDAVKGSYESTLGSLKEQLDSAKSQQSLQADALKDQLECAKSQHALALAAMKEQMAAMTAKELELKTRDAEILLQKAKAEAAAEMAGKQLEASKFEMLYLEAERKLHAALEGTLLKSQECVIAGLQKDLRSKDEELAVLKKTNFGRGVIGESMIADFLRRTYSDACVEDKSHVKHSCDIWMTMGNGEYFAFESKFKDTINSKGDIDKFYNDVGNMSRDAKFLGGVFVSCKTSNIPGKGSLCVEVFNDRPVMFVGFENEGFDGAWLKQCLVILFQLAQHQKSVAGKSSSIQDVIKKLVPLLDKIKKIRGSIDKVRKVHLTSVLSLTDDMDKELACMFEEIVGVTGYHSEVLHVCQKCNQAFKTKVALGKHVKACM